MWNIYDKHRKCCHAVFWGADDKIVLFPHERGEQKQKKYTLPLAYPRVWWKDNNQTKGRYNFAKYSDSASTASRIQLRFCFAFPPAHIQPRRTGDTKAPTFHWTMRWVVSVVLPSLHSPKTRASEVPKIEYNCWAANKSKATNTTQTQHQLRRNIVIVEVSLFEFVGIVIIFPPFTAPQWVFLQGVWWQMVAEFLLYGAQRTTSWVKITWVPHPVCSFAVALSVLLSAELEPILFSFRFCS